MHTVRYTVTNITLSHWIQANAKMRYTKVDADKTSWNALVQSKSTIIWDCDREDCAQSNAVISCAKKLCLCQHLQIWYLSRVQHVHAANCKYNCFNDLGVLLEGQLTMANQVAALIPSCLFHLYQLQVIKQSLTDCGQRVQILLAVKMRNNLGQVVHTYVPGFCRQAV